jgi:hypothetical protein
MSAISTLRGTIAAALSDNTAWQVFSFPPATPLANSIVVEPGDPYIEPSNDHYKTVKPKVNFKLIVLAPMFDNQGNLINIEDFYLNIVNKLEASNLAYSLGTFTAPAVLQGTAGDLLSGEVTISVLSDWS